eukprot:m.148200 g.148200  ORF g.148200 m.148200 type:complete len:367 (+) comp15055_c17_seq2:4034-5134(+)
MAGRPGRSKLLGLTIPTREAPPEETPLDPRGYFLFKDATFDFSQLDLPDSLSDCPLLGRGQFASVYAVHIKDRAGSFRVECAVKQVREWPSMREVDLLRKAAGPRIVLFHGYTVKLGLLHMFFERMAASLADALMMGAGHRAGDVPEPILRNIAVSVLKGLFDLQRLGIMHRDIKPGNILLSREGLIKIGDLGVAKETQGKAMTLTGTMVYKPPERLQMGAHVQSGYDQRSDVWACGLTVLELACGAFPYGHVDGAGFSALNRILKDEPPACPERYSAELRAFVHACMQKNLASRPYYFSPSDDKTFEPLETLVLLEQPHASAHTMIEWYSDLHRTATALARERGPDQLFDPKNLLSGEEMCAAVE